MTNNKELVEYLKNSEAINLKGLSKIKTVYRPYICPFDNIINLLPNNTKIFDIGCGSGSFLSIVQHFKNPERIAGVEISDSLFADAISLFKNRNVDANIYKYDGIAIPEAIADYTYISMIDVFHHIPKNNQEKFIIELHEKMSIGSYLIFKDIDADSPLVFFNKMHDLILSKEIGNEISLSNARKIFENVGFEIVYEKKQTMIVYPHYTLMLRKI